MAEGVKHFYDRLASNYHLIFEDWDASMKRQAATLGAILERECGAPSALRILDCACGIGTQTLGLASLGFTVTACDLSPASVERTRVEAAKRRLDVQQFIADMLDLTEIPDGDFDAVVCMDNALPHLESDEELFQAATQIRRKLRAGATFMGSIRDYDSLVQERPVVVGPAFYSDQGSRRIVHQVWDWSDERRYAFHLYIMRALYNERSPRLLGDSALRLELSCRSAGGIQSHSPSGWILRLPLDFGSRKRLLPTDRLG